MKSYIYLIAFFSALFCFLSSCNSKAMRANKQHYLACKKNSEGKSNKAISHIKKALKLDPKNEFYIDGTHLLLKKGDKKGAMRFVDKIASEDDDTRIEKVELILWKGIFALNNSQRKEAIKYSQKAIDLLDMYQVPSPILYSHAYCNLAVAEILDQSLNRMGKENPHFSKVHLRDFKRAKGYLETAIRFNPNNCVAKFNYEVVMKILKDPLLEWSYGYLPDSSYQNMILPKLDCFNKKKESKFGFDYTSLTKELKESNQIILVLDISGSMSSYVVKEGKSGVRFELMKEAVDHIFDHLDKEILIGAITVGGSCTTDPILQRSIGDISNEELQSEITTLPLYGGTPLTDRLEMTVDMFANKRNDKKTILLFSDGIGGCNRYSNDACQLGKLFNDDDISFYAFSLLLEENSTALEYSVYQCLVNATDGLLLGVTEENKTVNKTRNITTDPFSVPLKINDIAETELTPFLDNPMAAFDSLTVDK